MGRLTGWGGALRCMTELIPIEFAARLVITLSPATLDDKDVGLRSFSEELQVDLV